MFILEEESDNSHKRKAFQEFAESDYLGSCSEQNSKHSLERFPEPHESFRVAFEPKCYQRNSRKSFRRDGAAEEADVFQQRLSLFACKIFRWFEVRRANDDEENENHIRNFLTTFCHLKNTISVL